MPRNKHTIPRTLLVQALERLQRGESLATIAAELHITPKSLDARLRFLRREAMATMLAAGYVMREARAGSAEPEEPQAPAPESAPRPVCLDAPRSYDWTAHLRPKGLRMVLELVDAGVGELVVVQTLEDPQRTEEARCAACVADEGPCRSCRTKPRRPVVVAARSVEARAFEAHARHILLLLAGEL